MTGPRDERYIYLYIYLLKLTIHVSAKIYRSFYGSVMGYPTQHTQRLVLGDDFYDSSWKFFPNKPIVVVVVVVVVAPKYSQLLEAAPPGSWLTR